ncbi:hypothetical protein AAH991_29990 [Microbispora sp. ZYX-F-249]|uniref:Uncharacterized protein n=1 Tax=Microbispora maris TaxID=3144104 RepID=A0ABV0AXE0_9ACTN
MITGAAAGRRHARPCPADLVVGRRLGLPVAAVPQENSGPFGPIFAMNQPASSALTLGDLENIQP